MKISNILLTIITMISITCSATYAGDHPSELSIIRSQDKLRNYALSLVSTGSRYAYCDSMDWSYTNTVAYAATDGVNGEQVLEQLFSVPFSYRVLNAADQVISYSYLYDTNWNVLFVGSGYKIASEISPTNGIYTGFWMQSIPILSNVLKADLLIYNEKSQTTEVLHLYVNDAGQIMWPPWYSGYNNILLAVTYADGVVLTYKTSDPVASTPDVTYSSDSYGIDGHYIIKSSARASKLQIMETWNLPSAYLELSRKQVVTIDVLGLVQDGKDGKAYFERPVSVDVTDASGAKTTVDLNLDSPTEVSFLQGQYRLEFNWTKFGQQQFYYTGGKG